MRDRALIAVVSALFILVGIGLFYNQILKHGYYFKLSRNNSIRIVPIDGPRGSIFDRTGKALVTNRMSFDVKLVYQEINDRRKLAGILRDILGMPSEKIVESLEKAGARPYAGVTIAEDIPKEKAFVLEEASCEVSGLHIETRSKRDYILGMFGSHLFGYLSAITEEELERLKDEGYRITDLVGRGGLEKYYERELKGVDGGTQIEVDSRGRQTRVLGVKEPEAGKDLQITIDASLQVAADKLLGDRKGAIIAMDPSNGEILAIASHPSFDPNIFVRPGTSRERLQLLNDKKGRPMSNKAISGIYPPGSVFKVVVASAALDTKKIDAHSSFFCSGTYNLGRASFDCWKAEGHGWQDVIRALMNSCNIFFYNTGRIVGPDSIESYAQRFGFGALTGIDLPDEVRGLVPGRAWKRAHRKIPWYEGDTLNYSIGQGYLLVTPIQVLNMIAVVANNGNLVRPHIVRRVGGEEMPLVKSRPVGLDGNVIKIVREGLFEVVNNDAGTGKRAKVKGVAVAGKTGTAQNPQGRTHAWFCGFAPFERAKICLVVLLEHGGKGGVEPAQIGQGFFEEAKRLGYL
ncbi:MAG: penicillin-binding protein 2 [Candidatus Omnitrophica bacterium]|nr:penicillin-binding protein 2 [Candidatus Omnitrophota bacterium]